MDLCDVQVIVTTPEKWDVVTRKGGDGSLVSSVGLIMIDEVSWAQYVIARAVTWQTILVVGYHV